MAYGIRVFRKDFVLSWRKARRAAKLFKESPAKWPPELKRMVQRRSLTGTLAPGTVEVANIIVQYVNYSSPAREKKETLAFDK